MLSLPNDFQKIFSDVKLVEALTPERFQRVVIDNTTHYRAYLVTRIQDRLKSTTRSLVFSLTSTQRLTYETGLQDLSQISDVNFWIEEIESIDLSSPYGHGTFRPLIITKPASYSKLTKNHLSPDLFGPYNTFPLPTSFHEVINCLNPTTQYAY